MFRLDSTDFSIISFYLEGFLYGIYSGIFIIYLKYQAARKDANKSQNVIFYAICILYVLSAALLSSDISQAVIDLLGRSADTSLNIETLQNTLFGCCDFISQFILIYRCWIVWRSKIRVIIIPSILAIAFLAVWLVPNPAYIVADEYAIPEWASVLTLLGLALSLTVNALVTGLIIFKIFMVFREVRTPSDDQTLGANDGRKLRNIIFMLVESGTALFAIQLVRFVISLKELSETQDIMIGIHEMFTGITPTFILVRTTMGLSFDEDKSMEELAIGSLRFVSNHANSVSEMGITIVDDEDKRDEDDIAIRQDKDIEVVERSI